MKKTVNLAKKRYGSFAGYKKCLAKHACFHVEAGKLASAINAGNFMEAAVTLDLSSAYTTESIELKIAIMNLKKEVDSKYTSHRTSRMLGSKKEIT
jgi:methyl-accepting chemotaxis protein